MAGFQSTRSRVGFFTDDIDDWMAQRNAQLATREEDEAAGRLAWGAATRDGQSLAAPRPGDVIALGASTASSGAAPAGGVADVEPEQTGGDAIKPLQPAAPDGDLKQPPRLRLITAKPGDSISRLVGSSDPRAIGRFLSLNNMDPDAATIRPDLNYVTPTAFDDASDEEMGAGRRLLAADNTRIAALTADRARRNVGTGTSTALREGDRDIRADASVSAEPSSRGVGTPDDLNARRAAYLQGYFGGFIPGIGRGGLHAVEGAAGGVRLGLKMADPVKRILGHSALEPLEPIALGVVGSLAGAAQDPRAAWRHLKTRGRNVAQEAIPGLAPLPAKISAAHLQGRRIGMNDGEIGFNLAAIPLGGEAAEALESSAIKRSALDAAAYERRAIPPKIASYFAEPYPTHGMGSHWFSRDATWPAFLGGERLPSSFIESRYNVWKPVGATRGQVAEGHYLNDFRFGGGRLRDAKGKGSGWSGKRLGWEKNPPLVRFIERMPAVTKGTLAGIGLAASDTARGGGGQR